MLLLVFVAISRAVAIDGVHELLELNLIKEKFSEHLKDKDVLDIGANIGNHSIFLSKIAKNIFSFEPNPLIYSLLKINTLPFKNIKIFNYGASDKTITLLARVSKENWGGGRISLDQQGILIPKKFLCLLKLRR